MVSKVQLLEQRNAELEKELVVKNRALTIESSLEKVRTIAMRMNKAEDLLNVCEVMFKELQSLGFNELRNAMIHTFVDEQNYFIDYDYADFTGGQITRIPSSGFPLIERFIKEIRESSDAFMELAVTGVELEDWKAFRKAGGQIDDPRLDNASSLYYYYYSVDAGDIGISTFESISDEKREVLKRFRNLFDFAYSKYTDIEKAQAQARAAQIELALEKVRARAMAMQKSDELAEAAKLLYDELRMLKIDPVTCGYAFINEEQQTQTVWVTLPDGTLLPDYIVFPLTGDLILNDRYRGWKQKEPLHKASLKGEVNKEHHRFLASQVPANVSTEIFAHIPENIVFYSANFSAGYLMIIATETFSAEVEQMIIRFAKVFEITYTRFLDLQRAEAQARTAQIELAMERVRARTMAMQKSDELTDVAALLFKQVAELGIEAWTTGFNVWSDDNNYWTDYVTNPLGGFIEPYTIDTTKHSAFANVSEAKKKGEEFYVQCQEGEMLKDTYRHLSIFADKNQFDKMLEGGFQFPTQQFDHFVFGSKVSLMFITYKPVPEAHNIFKRFGNVFEQTYTRFLDLQRAEAQAREAKIEVALERVRARAMAMQKSDELDEINMLMMRQLESLDMSLSGTGIHICYSDKPLSEAWMWDILTGKMPKVIYNHTHDPLSTKMYEGWKKGETFYIEEVKGEKLQKHLKYLLSLLPDPTVYEDIIPEFVFHTVYFTYGFIVLATPDHCPTEHPVFFRFAKVFEQTYTRFLDIQKAESQAREERIEAALERVRSRSMAMHESEEVMDVAVSLYDELQKLDFTFGATSAATIIIMDEKTGNMEHWLAGFIQKNHVESYEVNNIEHPLHAAQLVAWREGAKFVSLELSGPALKEYAEEMFTQTGYRNLPDEEKAMLSAQEHVVFNLAYMSHGALMWAPSALSGEDAIILQRFAKVFEQTYTRFLDLLKAEGQAREATIEAALEKIRSRSLAMHHSNELKSVIAVMFEKLKELNVLLGTVAIWLFNKETMDSTFWVGNDWQEPAMIHLPYNEQLIKEDTNYRDSWQAWLTGESYMNRGYNVDQKDKYFRYVFAHNDLITIPPSVREIIMQAHKYIACLAVEKNSALYFDCWQGATYNEGSIQVLKRVAKVFEQAYVRFLDLQKAETLAVQAEQDLIEIKAARKKAEDTLETLKATQKQLIQAEKMASLGELTAGIAHEIQNPLNFVNNFSETNVELVEEAEAELKTGNQQEVFSILADIKENEQKINHHGRRAENIVKGMLEHSRSSKGEKQEIDINELADEYLKLAYHGFRAKDKSFNANIDTDLDEGIGKVNIVPQDIGRVLLNLFNNAFYAVAEKNRHNSNGYEPKVSVRSERVDNKIKILVADNGTGIPQAVIDKIYQPFFTTKPAGKGTGLGLSLSYDIVKAHGGEFQVESKEGEGAIFTVELPA